MQKEQEEFSCSFLTADVLIMPQDKNFGKIFLLFFSSLYIRTKNVTDFFNFFLKKYGYTTCTAKKFVIYFFYQNLFTFAEELVWQ